MPKSLAKALELHQQGDWSGAAESYRQVLAADPQNPSALHLLGVLEHQRGNQAKAIDLIGQAVSLQPNAAAFHANLGEAYRSLGQFDRAIGCYSMALRLAPDFPQALANLGLAQQAQGKLTEAEAQFRRALEVQPDFAAGHNNLGVLLRESARPQEALQHFRRAVECDESFAPAVSNLGQLLTEAGQVAEGLAHCQHAVRLQPNVAAIHHNFGNALRLSNRPTEARAAYLEALRLNPRLAAAHVQLGLLLWNEGQAAQAAVWLKQATELEPDNVNHWSHLAELYDELEEFALSTPCWQRVLQLDPQRAAAHVSLGWALQEQGRLSYAEQCYRDALREQPNFASAIANLGGLHEEYGDLATAERCFREALRIVPDSPIFHARLATLLRSRLPAADQAALEALLQTDLSPGFRARLCFALAHVFDAQCHYESAAEYLREAHRLARDSCPPSRVYRPEEHERFVDNLIRAFDDSLCVRLQDAGAQSRQPVFIFGLPRSGTTLLEQVLACHSQVYAAGELRVARRTFDAVPAAAGERGSTFDALPLLTSQAVDRLAAQHLRELAELADLARPPAPRIVDKLPDNYLYLGLLAVLFPRATFVHARRDLRDAALSCWMTDFRSIHWANEPQHIVSRFAQYQRLMQHWRGVLNVTIHDFDYEEVVTDLEANARRLVAACGLDWEPDCTMPHRAQRPVRTASLTQVREPVYQRSVARWRNYEQPLAELFDLLKV
jgi:tetratricopeptide (TPR) repeat protein